MLVLTRRIGEKLIIRDDIEITVVQSQGATVRFGIEAPQEISVHREEIYRRIKAEKLTEED